METSLYPQSNHGIMDEEEEDELGSVSSFSNDDDQRSSNSVGSSSSDFTEDASSSMEGPLFEMTSLISQLPFKRGLSKHFEGKSQSFTSLSNVKCLEDLVKPERPLSLIRRRRRSRQQLKSSKSYGWGLDTHRALSPKGCSRAIAKKSSRGSSFSFSSSSSGSSGMKRATSFLGSRPPIAP
ncbi:uncharacterized protein M6B38_310960 [Iris pallida]|uniref:Uncharacterized protein n=1 Tax=Iris pallida TaxID=29817 RepID=A0AAX6HH87_IRIPA|nr:uncharacterized protein M6B38_310960 [Iris pallida]